MARFTPDNGSKACSMEMDFGSTPEEKVTKGTGGMENLKELVRLSSRTASTANQEEDTKVPSSMADSMASEEKPLQMETLFKEYTEKTNHVERAHTNGSKDQYTKESFIKEIEKEWANSIHLSNSSTKDSIETTGLKANARSSCQMETLITVW